MEIEVFADIWCPFTHVGLRALAEERAHRGRTDVTLWVRAWPLELVNGAPMDGHHAAERGDPRAQTVHRGTQARHFDAERTYQRGILGCGAKP